MSFAWRRLAIPLIVALAAVTTACSSASPASDAAKTGSTDGSAAATTAATPEVDAGDQVFGCTEEMLAFLADEAYADVPPVDPAQFAFPDGIRIASTPACYVFEEDGAGASRASAIFVDDPAGVLAEAADAFTAAGWKGDAATGLWWSDGDDPTTAARSVGGVEYDIDGQPTAWFTYAF